MVGGAKGLIVAVVGVSDAPAPKSSDVGSGAPMSGTPAGDGFRRR
jgi:hypothetical protein